MIVFYADHGEHLYDQGNLLYHGHTMAEAVLHVPLVVKYPESTGVKPQTTRRVVSLVDLAPTVVDLVGAEEAGDDFDGISLLDTSQEAKPGTLFADYQLYQDERSSVQRGPMKLIMNLSKNTEILIDRRKGRIVEDEEVQRSLRDAFEAYAEKSRELTSGIRSHHVVDPDETIEQLRSLGYLE